MINNLKISEKLAELLGIITGDGNIYIDKSSGVYQVKICLDAKTEIDYALEFVLPLLQDVLQTLCSWYFGLKNEIFVYFNRKDATMIIKDLVDKKKIPSFLWDNDKLLKAYIRGLIDTDGSVFSKTTNKSIAQIEFYQKIESLTEDVRRALLKLGINCSKCMKKKTKYCVGIYGKTEVEKYFNMIGFSNLKNLIRYRYITNAPIV